MPIYYGNNKVSPDGISEIYFGNNKVYTKTQTGRPYLTIWCPTQFVMLDYNSYASSFFKGWDGTMEYSTNKANWSIWDGTNYITSAKGSDNNYYIYLRGTNNTYCNGPATISNKNYCMWVFYNMSLSGQVSNVHVSGNIENLLDYNTVLNGQHPSMAVSAFSYLFQYQLIVEPPILPAVTLTTGCYAYMFYECTSLYVSDTLTTRAPYAWRIPESGTFTESAVQNYMFYNCLGTRTSNHMAGVAGKSYTYYTQNQPTA